MIIRHGAAVALLIVAACSSPAPLEQLAPISGHSPQSAAKALDIAASSLGAQGFRVTRDDAAGTVTGGKGTRRDDLGPEVHCNLPPTVGNLWVSVRVTVTATPRDEASTLRVEGQARMSDYNGERTSTDPSRGCVSTGLVERRVALALGLAGS